MENSRKGRGTEDRDHRREAEKNLLRRVDAPPWKWFKIDILCQTLIAHGRSFVAFRENSHFDFTRILPPTRRLLVRLGGKFAKRGVLRQGEDIFHLTYEEIEKLLQGRMNPTRVKTLVIRRTARRRRLQRVMNRPSEGSLGETERSDGVLTGVGASKGVYRGRVRIIEGPQEFAALQSGEVLVSHSAGPSWTPLFHSAGALVMEKGGVTSHAAIVAREYAIPAVMRSEGAKDMLSDGQMVRVDGTKGIVSWQIDDRKGN